jgi:transcription elongation factor Elf1
MSTKFDDNKNKIVEELKKRISDFECPICKRKEFVLGGGYFAHDLQQDLKNRQIGGVNIPTVPIICKNCGYIAEFAAGTLGLLPKDKEKDANE